MCVMQNQDYKCQDLQPDKNTILNFEIQWDFDSTDNFLAHEEYVVYSRKTNRVYTGDIAEYNIDSDFFGLPQMDKEHRMINNYKQIAVAEIVSDCYAKKMVRARSCLKDTNRKFEELKPVDASIVHIKSKTNSTADQIMTLIMPKEKMGSVSVSTVVNSDLMKWADIKNDFELVDSACSGCYGCHDFYTCNFTIRSDSSGSVKVHCEDFELFNNFMSLDRGQKVYSIKGKIDKKKVQIKCTFSSPTYTLKDQKVKKSVVDVVTGIQGTTMVNSLVADIKPSESFFTKIDGFISGYFTFLGSLFGMPGLFTKLWFYAKWTILAIVVILILYVILELISFYFGVFKPSNKFRETVQNKMKGANLPTYVRIKPHDN